VHTGGCCWERRCSRRCSTCSRRRAGCQDRSSCQQAASPRQTVMIPASIHHPPSRTQSPVYQTDPRQLSLAVPTWLGVIELYRHPSHINEVALRRAGLVLRWVPMSGYVVLVFTYPQTTQLKLTQPRYPFVGRHHQSQPLNEVTQINSTWPSVREWFGVVHQVKACHLKSPAWYNMKTCRCRVPT